MPHPHFDVTPRGINTEDFKSSGSESEDNFDEGSELMKMASNQTTMEREYNRDFIYCLPFFFH